MNMALESLLQELRSKRENLDSLLKVKNIIEVKEVKEVVSKEDKELQKFLKEDILYLTKEIIDLNNTISSLQENQEEIFEKSNYDYKTVTIEAFDKNDWFRRDEKNITIDKEIIINLDNNAYISYKEQNIDFSKAPNNKVLNVKSGYEYKFNISGEQDNDVESILFIIAYNGQIKNNVYSTKFNNEINIRFAEEVTSVRLALRVSGKGSIKINNIKIEEKKRLNFLKVDKYRELGYDKPTKLKELKMAAICDEFTYQCLNSEVDLITFTPENWKAIFTINTPHIMFVESAWHGLNNSWNRKIATNSEASRIYIKEIINWCKENNIPTVFWNKEDPVHFEAFIDTAKLCDYVFTTDENKVKDYKVVVGHSNVFSMQFFAQPKEHNPTRICKRRIEEACFAGSYYAEKYIERQNDMLNLLKITKEYGLTIYDRNFGSDDEQYKFPVEYRQFVKGKLSPSEISKAYKGYKFMVNVNSVIDSPTMFSRRVFEGLASGTPVISTYSDAIKNTFNDIVIMDQNAETLEAKFKEVLNNRGLYEKKALLGLREVYKKHTIEARLLNICNIVGIEVFKTKNKICVLSMVNTIDEYEKFCDMFNAQLIDSKVGVVITNLDIKPAGNLIVTNKISEVEQYINESDYFTFVNLNNYYGKNYLVDLEIATQYSDATILGKSNIYSIQNNKLLEVKREESYIYTKEIHKDTMLINSKLVKKYSMKYILDVVRNSNIELLLKCGERSYSIDKYNFIENCNYHQENIISEIDI